MFKEGDELRLVKEHFRSSLNDLFSVSEVNQLLKVVSCYLLDISDSEYILSDTYALSGDDVNRFIDIEKRLLKNEPLQYVLGTTEFYGLELKTDYRALIPRPETEELVDWIAGDLKEVDSPLILDLCTGSGCIALALKSALKKSDVHAVDLSKDCLALTIENSEKLQLSIEVRELNVLDKAAYIFEPKSFDCWVSNPPYIPLKDKERMEANVLDFEPEMALFVEDDDPLIFYREIAQNALLYLKDSGCLYFEIHEDLGEEVNELLKDLGFVNIQLRKDLQGKARMMRAQKRKFTA